MNTDDIIVGRVKFGSFKFNMSFDFLNIHQFITKAVYDSGCSHSLISVSSLKLPSGSTADLLQEFMFYNADFKLSTGKGVESKDIAVSELQNIINIINNIKVKYSSKDDLKVLIDSEVTQEQREKLFKSLNLRYRVFCNKLAIDGVELGNTELSFAFNIRDVNLIGMHIIKQLRTTIFEKEKEIILLATPNSNIASTKLLVAENEINGFFSQIF